MVLVFILFIGKGRVLNVLMFLIVIRVNINISGVYGVKFIIFKIYYFCF